MTLIYGHRGARAEAPENTLPSFQKALDAGVTRVELDLHLSADQQLMVIHDPTLKRTTGETDIALTLNLDGTGQSEIETGILMVTEGHSRRRRRRATSSQGRLRSQCL